MHRCLAGRCAGPLLLLLLLLLPLCALACHPSSGSAPTSGTPPGGATTPRIVRLATVTPGTLDRTIEVSGTLLPDEQATLGFKLAGRLADVPVDMGTRVRKNEVIARLDPTDFELRLAQTQAALGQARARLGLPAEGDADEIDPDNTGVVREAKAVLEEAKSRLERQRSLVEQKVASDAELDPTLMLFRVSESRLADAREEVRIRQAILRQRRAELAIARQEMADTVLRAPFDGAVRQRSAIAGEFVTGGTPVVTVVKTQPLRLRMAVPERETLGLGAGQEVRLQQQDDERRSPGGRIRRVSPSVEEGNRILWVEAEIDNADGRLRPGGFARATIMLEPDRNRLLVPESAIVRFAGIEKVVMVKDGKAIERRVRTGRAVPQSPAGGPTGGGDLIEITDGLKAGDQVIVEPGNLVTGQAVTVAQ